MMLSKSSKVFYFIIVPQALKMLDLWLTLFLLRLPWMSEVNPVAVWLLSRGIPTTIFILSFATAVVSYSLFWFWNKIEHPELIRSKHKRLVRVICGFGLFFGFLMLSLPVINNSLLVWRTVSDIQKFIEWDIFMN